MYICKYIQKTQNVQKHMHIMSGFCHPPSDKSPLVYQGGMYILTALLCSPYGSGEFGAQSEEAVNHNQDCETTINR